MSTYTRSLTGAAVAYMVLHHLGLLPSGLGSASHGTRWVDWLDVTVPWLVLIPAASALLAAQVNARGTQGSAQRRAWAAFGAGALAYASGHGIHLAANSIGNQDPGPTAHLWDEVVGHYVWYAGVALVIAALASTMPDRPRPPAAAHLLGLGVGITWGTNAIGGGTLLFSVALAVVAGAFGWRHRGGLGVVLLVASFPAVGIPLVELVHLAAA